MILNNCIWMDSLTGCVKMKYTMMHICRHLTGAMMYPSQHPYLQTRIIVLIFLWWRHLVLLNRSIALVLYYTETTIFHILILGELSVQESWTKTFIVGPIPCLKYPIGGGRKDDN